MKTDEKLVPATEETTPLAVSEEEIEDDIDYSCIADYDDDDEMTEDGKVDEGDTLSFIFAVAGFVLILVSIAFVAVFTLKLIIKIVNKILGEKKTAVAEE